MLSNDEELKSSFDGEFCDGIMRLGGFTVLERMPIMAEEVKKTGDAH